MTQVTVNLTDTFEDWRVKTNLICANQGDIATLTTATQASLVAAINEIDATSGLGNLVEDTSPELGNHLDVLDKSIITSTTNGNITITPDGSGKIVLDNHSWPNADGNANEFLQTNGSGVLSFSVVNTDILGDASPQLGGSLDVNGQSIVSVSNGNITITPDGSGKIVLDGQSFPNADGTAGQVLSTNGSAVISYVPVITEIIDTATANQTDWGVAELPNGYVVGRIAVFLNGVKLLNGSDFTATNGVDVQLTTGAALNDKIEFQIFA
jgi:frataxin-like iron-binding protein CyaY